MCNRFNEADVFKEIVGNIEFRLVSLDIKTNPHRFTELMNRPISPAGQLVINCANRYAKDIETEDTTNEEFFV